MPEGETHRREERRVENVTIVVAVVACVAVTGLLVDLILLLVDPLDDVLMVVFRILFAGISVPRARRVLGS